MDVMKKKDNYKKRVIKSWTINLIYYIASLFMPSILLFDLYNRNRVERHIDFLHVLVIAGILAVIGLLLLVAFKLLVKSIEGALVLSVLAWLMFWLYEWLLGTVRRILPIDFLPSRVFALLLLIIIALIVIAFRRYKPPLGNIRPAFNMLAICVIVFFIFNFVPGVNHERVLAQGRRATEEGTSSFYIKRSFVIDESLPTPDIYWIHVDGMMSLEVIERFWGLCYDHFREELKARGFMIYEDALVNASFTHAFFPAILSPAFYDSFWRESLSEVETKLRYERVAALNNIMAEHGLVQAEDIIPYYELFSALVARGYEMAIFGGYEWLPVTFEHLEEDNHILTRMSWQRFQRGALPTLLELTTPLSLNLISGFEGVATVEDGESHRLGPRFEYSYMLYTHMHNLEHILDPENIPIEEVDTTRYDLYPQGVDRAINAMLNNVDNILERNPNAVIILQSDHGFHINITQQYLLDQGYSLEQVLELMHSVFSAVRIPDEYGGLEEPIAPLNITRVLVNRFVGENYQLLLSE